MPAGPLLPFEILDEQTVKGLLSLQSRRSIVDCFEDFHKF